MTTTNTLGSTTASSTSGSALTASNLSQSMNADTFMKMFTTELANQNPLSPMDTSAFLNQFSQITQVQSVTELTQSMSKFQNIMSSLLNSSNANQGVGLLGKNVNFTDGNGQPSSGLVNAMAIAPDGSVKLNINGAAVDLGSVTQVN